MWNSLDLQCPVDDLVAYPPQDHYIMETLQDAILSLADSFICINKSKLKIICNSQTFFLIAIHIQRLRITLATATETLQDAILSLADSFICINKSKLKIICNSQTFFLIAIHIQRLRITLATATENLRDFVTVLTTSADILTSESPLWNEMKILQNIQAKYKRILRCDRFLIFFHRVGHCLRKMVLLNLSKSYLDLAERFLVGFQDTSGTPLLPSRQQVEYVLLRTLSASKLVCEAVTYSRESFCHLLQKLKVGHLILDLIMATSIIARLNILMRATLEKLCSIYKQVLFWRYKVKRGEFQWNEKFNFPQDVEEWIKSFEPAQLKPLSMSKEDIEKVKSMLSQKNGVHNKMEVSDTESVILVDEIKTDSPEADIIDYGEVIPRTKTKVNGTLVQKKKAENYQNLMKKKKMKPSSSLTNLQKSLLQKIIKVQSLKDLADVWYEIKSLSPDYLPKVLTEKKKEIINKLFAELKAAYADKKFNKTYKTRPDFLKKAILVLCKKVGFIADDIRMCHKKVPDPSNEPKILNSPAPRSLIPVNNIKELRLLYKQLKIILKFKKEPEKLLLLRTIFQHRITDIKNLRKKGERLLAKKLTRCTSKEFLALYR